MDAQQITCGIRDAVVGLQDAEVKSLIARGLDLGLDPVQMVTDGVTAGLSRLGQMFEDGDVYLPELILGGKIGTAAIEVLKPHLPAQAGSQKGLLVLGTVAGDVHEIGKNLVRLLATIAGYQVVDLGADVASARFVETVRELRPHFLGMSALLTTTIPRQRDVIELLERAGLRHQVKVLVGGAPVRASWAKEIGADGYAENAGSAVKELDRLCAETR